MYEAKTLQFVLFFFPSGFVILFLSLAYPLPTLFFPRSCVVFTKWRQGGDRKGIHFVEGKRIDESSLWYFDFFVPTLPAVVSSTLFPCEVWGFAPVACVAHTFSAFWLRSSVVSVLISLISDISSTAG